MPLSNMNVISRVTSEIKRYRIFCFASRARDLFMFNMCYIGKSFIVSYKTREFLVL